MITSSFSNARLKIEVADGCAQRIQMRLVDNPCDYFLETAKCLLGIPIACIE